MQPQFLITIIFLTLLPLHTVVAAAEPVETSDDWLPIKDLTSPYVLGIAKFAVTMLNQENKKTLTLASIKSGEAAKYADAIKYRLKIATYDSSCSTDYTVVVLDSPRNRIRVLKAFYTSN
jgi:cystatin-C